MEEIIARLQDRFSPSAMGGVLADVIPEVVAAIVIFAVFYLVWKILGKAFELSRQRMGIDETAATFVRTALKYTVLTIGLLTALAEVGINVAAIVASLGVAGLTLGFAARDTLSNLISGIFIFWDRPFTVGDLIELEDHYGRVENITLRSTRVVTPGGKMLAIPNSTIINSIVASFTNFPHIRLEVDVTLGVEEDLNRAREIFYGIISGDDRYLSTPAPQMVVQALNDYNTQVQFRVWLKDEKAHLAERFRLRELLFEAMRGEGIEMPFETFQLAPFRAEAKVEQKATA